MILTSHFPLLLDRAHRAPAVSALACWCGASVGASGVEVTFQTSLQYDGLEITVQRAVFMKKSMSIPVLQSMLPPSSLFLGFGALFSVKTMVINRCLLACYVILAY